MQQKTTCPLCQNTATRDTLRLLNGYCYACPDCGGKFEIGTAANGRAERGEMHHQIPDEVRRLIAQGKLPRIEFEASNGSFRIIPDVRNP